MEAKTNKEKRCHAYVEKVKETERMMQDSTLRAQFEAMKRRRVDQFEITIDDEDAKYSEWCVSILKADEKKEKQSDIVKPKIPKVPEMFTKQFESGKQSDLFTPKVVSVGPYHHGKDKLQLVQDLKPLFAKRFMKHNEDDLFLWSAKRFMEHTSVPLSTYCDDILSMIKEVRQFYDEKFITKFTDVQLMEMMFLDGCFVLHFIYCFATFTPEALGMTNYQIELACQDLFLMDNQIPYKVLNCLMKNIEGGSIYELFMAIYIQMLNDVLGVSYTTPLHLLDLLRQILVGDPEKRVHLPKKHWEGPVRNYWKSPMLRTVKELRAIGIYFKENGESTINEISFKSFGIYGRLSLPRLTFDNSTKSIFLNLIAYESCIDKSDNDFAIASYISFLDSLIDNAEDVKELRSAGIIRNNLNSDEEVAELINGIGSKLDFEGDTLLQVKTQMRKYLSSRRKLKIASWFAEVSGNHFRSPLTIFIVIAATFAIFLTAVQTYYTVFK